MVCRQGTVQGETEAQDYWTCLKAMMHTRQFHFLFQNLVCVCVCVLACVTRLAVILLRSEILYEDVVLQ